jgi:hypothetical protein
MFSIYDEGLGRLMSAGRNSPTKEAAKESLFHYLSGFCSEEELAALSMLTPDELATRYHYKIFKHLTRYPATREYTSLLGVTIDVGTWLRGLGLGQYASTFQENEIDDTVLPTLTAENLKDLGVSLVGHRRKLLTAIAALRTDASAKAAPEPTARSTHPAPASPAPEATQYANAFHENEINGTVLRNLTAENFNDLGVSLVEHRRKLLDAIAAALRTDASAKAASEPRHDRPIRPPLCQRRKLPTTWVHNCARASPRSSRRISSRSFSPLRR